MLRWRIILLKKKLICSHWLPSATCSSTFASLPAVSTPGLQLSLLLMIMLFFMAKIRNSILDPTTCHTHSFVDCFIFNPCCNQVWCFSGEDMQKRVQQLAQASVKGNNSAQAVKKSWDITGWPWKSHGLNIKKKFEQVWLWYDKKKNNSVAPHDLWGSSISYFPILCKAWWYVKGISTYVGKKMHLLLRIRVGMSDVPEAVCGNKSHIRIWFQFAWQSGTMFWTTH